MLTPIEQTKFLQSKYSIQFAYYIGVLSESYAKLRMRDLYARTFGVFSAIYREMLFCNFSECLCD